MYFNLNHVNGTSNFAPSHVMHEINNQRNQMKTKFCSAIFYVLIYVSTLVLRVNAAGLDTNQIQQVTGIKGAWNDTEGVYKITSPRTDVKVSVDGWTMPPFMGLASWAAFTEQKAGDAMVMGDTVLFQDEVNPVMSV